MAERGWPSFMDRLRSRGAYMDVSYAGQVYAWNSRYLGGSPSGCCGPLHRRQVTAGDNGYRLQANGKPLRRN